jgi:hypothetical protein
MLPQWSLPALVTENVAQHVLRLLVAKQDPTTFNWYNSSLPQQLLAAYEE